MRAPITPRTALWFAPVIAIALGSLLAAATLNTFYLEQEMTLELARSFARGSLSFINPVPRLDAVPWNGNIYWYQGPLPAILLIPFAGFESLKGIIAHQWYLQELLFLTLGLLVYILARRMNFSTLNAAYAAFAFCCASAVLAFGVISSYSYLSQLVALVLIFLALIEYAGRRRHALIGILIGLLMLTRTTAAIGGLFFLLSILFVEPGELREKWRRLLFFCIPAVVGVICFLAYNALRFGIPFEQGLGIQTLVNPLLMQAREVGLLNIAHIPANLYYAFLASPEPVFRETFSKMLALPFIAPSPWGMGIFFSSPYLLRLFCISWRDRLSWIIVTTGLCIATPLMMYYATGYFQFGYRYALDFLPYLFFQLLRDAEKRNGFTPLFRIAILGSGAWSAYLLWSFIFVHLVPEFFGAQ